jgi:hypothetical protein
MRTLRKPINISTEIDISLSSFLSVAWVVESNGKLKNNDKEGGLVSFEKLTHD